ncbi:hypothetical protein G6F64_015109 [Rhizopus arrhizus]|uniref:Uncharacterized protein n=1 Tax=Rhizopus oryzae TaxID=64495 RepID=A0A9P7BI05_RHIOR|nr:hypothetical protein G6F64_015109 [Rhizopus arrhizus]
MNIKTFSSVIGYQGDNRAQSDETTPFQILKAANLPAVPAPTNDPLLRCGAVDGALTRIIDGEPGLLVHSDCKTLRKALAGGYCYRRLAVSGERTCWWAVASTDRW